MHPNPLLGMGAYLTFDGCGRRGGQLFDAILEGSIDRDRQGRVNFGLVSAVGTSVDKARDNRAASSYGEHGAAGRRPGGSAEEGNEDSRDVTDVLIDEKGGDPVSGQRTDHLLPGRRPADNDLRAESAAQICDQLVEVGIIELSRSSGQGDARDWQPGAENLPGAAVAGRENDAATVFEGFEEIFDALQLAQSLDLPRL